MITKKVYNKPKRPSQAVQGGIQGHAGILQPLNAPNADLSDAVSVGQDTILALFNNTADVQFYRTGDSTVTVTDITDGIPVPPFSYLHINTGADTFIVTTADVFGYRLIDEAQSEMVTEHDLFPIIDP